MVFLSTILAKTYAWHSSSSSNPQATSSFFSNTAAAITNRSIAAAFAFGGHRHLRFRMILEEVCMGFFVIMPLAIIIGQVTIRLAIRGGGNYYIRKFIRPDIWTTLVIALVGDVIFEFLIPSLQCLPLLQEEAESILTSQLFIGSGGGLPASQQQSQLHHLRLLLQHFIKNRMANEMSFSMWLQQTWGFHCPQFEQFSSSFVGDDNDDGVSSSSYSYYDQYNHDFYFLRQRTVAVLLGIRMIFLCLGIYIGESFVPIALTGGIACGKSTVAQLLLNHNHVNNNTTAAGANNNNDDVDREGTFCIIDADSIGHEILLPPHVLAMNPPPPEFNKKHWTVQPHESVYHVVLNAFSSSAATVADYNNNNNTTTTNQQQEEEDNDEDDDNDNNVSGGGGVVVVKQEDVDSKSEKSNTSFSNNSKKLTGSKKPQQQQQEQQHQQRQQQHFLLDDHGLIDRTKLGTIVFSNAAARRRLGAITHPQILLVMMKRIIHCIYFLPIFASWDSMVPESSSTLLLTLWHYIWPFTSSTTATKTAATRGGKKRKDHHVNDDNDDDDETTVSNGSISTDVVCVDIPLLFESGQLCWLFALVICVATEKDDLILQRLQKRNPEWTKEHCQARIASQMPLSEKMRRADFVIFNNTSSMEDLQENVERVRIQVVQRIYGILGLTLMQMLLLVSASLISILIFSPTPSAH